MDVRTMGSPRRGGPFAAAADGVRDGAFGAGGTARDVARRGRRYENLYSRHDARAAAGHRLGRRPGGDRDRGRRSEEHTSELQSLMRISYAVFCLKKKKKLIIQLRSYTDQLQQITKQQYISNRQYT